MSGTMDATIWMVNGLIFVSHVALVYVGSRHGLVSDRWIGSTVIDHMGTLGYATIILLGTIFVGFLSYLLLRSYKRHILGIFTFILCISLFYNLYFAFS